MIVKIPIENTVDFVVGDITVKVDIKFLPAQRPTVREEMIIAHLNDNLGSIGYECENKVEEIVKKHLTEK